MKKLTSIEQEWRDSDLYTPEQNFSKNKMLKKGGEKTKVSQEQFNFYASEIAKCAADVVYFAENYYTIMTLDEGKQLIKLYDVQVGLLDVVQSSRYSVVLSSRQTGKSTNIQLYALWMALFNDDFKVLICSNKGDSAKEFLFRIKMAYELLPKWLKVGITDFNKTKIKFANDSQIICTNTSSSSGRGDTFNCLDGNTKVNTLVDGVVYDTSLEILSITNPM